MAIVLLPVYTAVTLQWVYMSQYEQNPSNCSAISDVRTNVYVGTYR
jgi:hypothetical protein